MADLGRDSNDAAICAAIIAMGRQLGLKIVAEGVETKEQLQFLATHGCTLAQGFYIARPVEAPEMAKLLRIGADEPRSGGRRRIRKSGTDVPLADYEAEMLIKVAEEVMRDIAQLRSPAAPSGRPLHVEAEMHDVAFLDEVLLSLEPQLAGVRGAGFALVLM